MTLQEQYIKGKPKPCVFCGSNDVCIIDNGGYKYGRCTKCGAEASAENTREEALKAWNKPYEEHQALIAENENLKDKLGYRENEISKLATRYQTLTIQEKFKNLELNKYKEALEFYANKEIYQIHFITYGEDMCEHYPINKDKGSKARQALNQEKGQDNDKEHIR